MLTGTRSPARVSTSTRVADNRPRPPNSSDRSRSISICATPSGYSRRTSSEDNASAAL
jgi:hypothetical protein